MRSKILGLRKLTETSKLTTVKSYDKKKKIVDKVVPDLSFTKFSFITRFRFEKNTVKRAVERTDKHNNMTHTI